MEKYIKPIIPLWKVLLFSLGFFGVQFVVMIFAISTPQFFGNFGAGSIFSTYMWLSVPVIGIFIQPIMGFVGDHLWGTYGRRGFFILLASSFGSVAILLIAFTQYPILSFFLVLIALIAINTLMVSYRAVTCEMTPPAERLAGYGMLTTLQLFGMLLAIIVKNSVGGEGRVISGYFGDNPPFISALLIIGGATLLITALFGTIFLKEYPNLGYRRYVSYVPFTSESETDLIQQNKISYIRQGAMWLSITILTLLVFSASNFQLETYTIPFVMLIFAILLIITHQLNKSKHFLSQGEKRFVELMTDVMNMPLVMKKLNIVLLFGWFAIFLLLGNLPGIIVQNNTLLVLSQTNSYGFDTISSCYLFFIVIAIVTTPILITTVRREKLALLLSATLFLMAITLLLYYCIQVLLLFIITLVVLGILLSVMMTIPYTILSYKLPSKRVGVFFGLFNIFTVIPFILVPSISQSFINSMSGIHYQTIIMSVSALFFAILFSLMITSKDTINQ